MTRKSAVSPWRKRIEKQLPLLGHRNWIVVADSAYPWQTASGIETIDTGSDQLRVVEIVLAAIEKSRHVRPLLYVDAELPFLSEEDAPGITKYRDSFGQILKKHETQALLHEEIIGKLDEAGNAFRILVLKTTLTLPCTSLFVQLDCGYWSATAERTLRGKLAKT